MENIRGFSESIDIENKKIILRSDYNVPIINEHIQDKTRIDLSIPFIENLLKRKAKILLFSHLGRPTKDGAKSLTLRPVFLYLKKKINTKIHFYSDKITNETKEKIPFFSSDRNNLDRIAKGEVHQGVISEVILPPLLNEESLFN